MNVEIEDLSSVKKKLIVTLPKDVVEAGLKKELVKISRESKLKGFRQGKAPFSMVEKVYMPEAMRRYSEQTVRESLQSIVETRHIDVAVRPVIEKEDFTDDGFVFHALLEVHPAVDLKKYVGLTFTRKPVVVSEAELSAKIDEMRNGFITYEDRGSDEQATDADVVNFEVQKYVLDGKDMGTSADERVDLSRQTVFHEIKTALVGMKAGEEKEFKFSYPDDMDDEKLKGKQAEFRLKLKKVSRKIQPADDELAVKLGYESADAMKAKVRDDIETSKRRSEDELFKKSMFTKLAEENPFDVPQGMIDDLAVKMVEDFARNLERAGVQLDQLKFDWEVIYENNKKEAEATLKRHYLMRSLKVAEKIDVTDEEIELRIGEIVASAQDREKAGLYFQNPSARRNIEMEIIEKKVVEFLSNNNTVTEA